MELTTRPRSGFNWPDTDEKKKSNEFDWPEVNPTRPEPELQTFTYQDRLNAAKEGKTIGANTELESVDGLRLEFIKGFEGREGDALMKGETMRNLSRDEVLNYIEAKEAQGFDYGRMMGGIAPAMGTVMDELTRGVFVRGSLDFASGASAPLIEGFHKNLGKESPMNGELRQALGNIQRGNPDRASMRLAARMPQGQGVTGGTLEERAQEYLTKAHVTNGQLMASLLGKKVKDLGYDKLPQWMIGGQRGEQEITEEMFGPIAESVGRAAWSEFVDSVPESDRKHLKKLGYDSIFDGFDRPKTISTTAQAKVAASTLVNFPARILASMGEGVAQAGHGTAMIGHMAIANWDGGLAKLDQSVNNYLANEALRYRKANNLPIPKKGDELLTGLPEDVVAGWKDKIKPLIEKRRDRIVESWMTKHQYMAEMERARQGKEPVISQALRDAGNDGAAEAFGDLVNKDLALGLSYVGDAPATVAVGAVRQGLTKGTVRSVAGRGVASKAAEGTGKVLKGVDEKIIAPFSRAPQAASDYVEDAIGVGLPKRVVGAADFVMTPAAAASSIVGGAGDVLEAVGRATSSGQTLQGTAAKIFNDPNAAPWLRNVAGKLQFADPFFEYGYNVMSGTAKGGVAGGAITLATGDEDMIAGGIGSGLGAGFAFAVPASMGGVQRQIKAKNTIDEWLGLKEQEASTAEKAGLTEQAQVLKDNVYILKNLPLETQLRAAELELIVKGFGGHAGKGDIPVEYIFSGEKNYAGYYDPDSQKVIVNLAKAEINDGASLAHEVMHALEHVDSDAMRTTLANINSVMFGDGGIYSMDAQRDRGNQYLGRFWEGIDAQRDKLLKMDPKDPDYAAAYEQYQSAKDSLNTELDKMGLAPDTREVTAEGFDANAKFQSIVRSEIRAEDFSSMYRSQDPGALLEGPSLVANVKRQVILAKSYSTLGRLRHALEKIFKVQFGEDGAPSPLFKNEKGEWATSNPMVNQLLKDYVTLRKNIGEQAEILAKAENNEVMVPTSEEMASNPLLMEMFKGDDHVVKDPTTGEPKLTPDGRPVILSSREVRKLQRERIKAIDEALQLVDDSGGLQRQADERTGKVRWGGGEEGWTAPMMNEAQVEAIMALPDNVIPANKKEQIKIFHEAMKAGKTVEVFYRGVTGATAKRAGWRQDSPFGVEITLDGNVNFRTINLNRLQDNIDRWTNKRNRKTKLDLWDENVSDFLADFATYRENHRNGRPGHFGLHPDEAIALARKERLNELVGVSGSEKARSVSIEGPRRRRAESTRSWQGILKIQPGDPDYTLSYPKLRKNLMPAGADKGGAEFRATEGSKYGDEYRPIPRPTDRIDTALAKAAEQYYTGKITRKEWDKAVKKYKPIQQKEKPAAIPTDEELFASLQQVKKQEDIGRLRMTEPGEVMHGGEIRAFRQDIKAAGKGVASTTTHLEGSKNVATGRYSVKNAIDYDGVVHTKDGIVIMNQDDGLMIARGGSKFPMATLEGKQINTWDASKGEHVLPKGFEKWVQMGVNPEMHAYGFAKSGKRVGEPIVAYNEALMLGNTVYIKNPTYGKRSEFLYMPAGKPGVRKALQSSEAGTVVDGPEIKITNSMAAKFMPAATDPGFNLSEVIGKKAFLMFADRMKIGEFVTRDGEVIELHGGPDHPDMVANKGKVGWRVDGGTIATRFLNAIDRTDGVGLVVLMGEDAVAGNRVFTEIILKEFKHDIENGLISKKDLREHFAEVQKVFREKSEGERWKGYSIKSLDQLMDDALSVENAMPFEMRSILNRQLASNAYRKKTGGIFWGDVVKRVIDYSDRDAYRNGDIVKVIQFEQGAGLVDPVKIGAPIHKAYNFAVKGKSVANVKGRLSMYQVMRDPLNKMFKGGDYLIPDPKKPGKMKVNPKFGGILNTGEIGAAANINLSRGSLDNPLFTKEITPKTLDASSYKKPLKFKADTKWKEKALAERDKLNANVSFMPAGKGGDIFYSNSSKALESPKVRNSATGAAMLNDILRQDPAARQEMKWIDLDRWLMDKKGKVTKEEVQDFIDTNQIAVVEKVRGGEESPEIRAAEEAVDDARQAMYDADDRGTYQEARDAEMAFEEATSNLEFVSKDFDPQFDKSDLSLPGAVKGSYRELELMLPGPKKSPKVIVESIGSMLGSEGEYVMTYHARVEGPNGYTSGRFESKAEAEVAASKIRKTDLKEIPANRPFKDSHFETDENVFAHVRFNERIDADGKRMLFIEEVQSDWAAKGRDVGFNEPYINGDIVGGREESVPAAPFVSKQKGDQYVKDDKWRALAMKRMIRWGADNGYDRVGWITGRDSADRYNLNTYVSKIEYMRLPGENQTMISAWDKAGSNVMSAKMIPNKDLVGTVGKDLARKIDSDKSGMGEFDGLDLAMGGKFHKQFYDVDLPNYTGKYVKKWGGKVGEVDVSLRAAEDVEALKGIPERTAKAHYVDITPQMKADVQQGQAMFMPAGEGRAPRRMGSATSRPARTRIPMGAAAKQLRMERDLKELKRN